jgi:hypothetical protein
MVHGELHRISHLGRGLWIELTFHFLLIGIKQKLFRFIPRTLISVFISLMKTLCPGITLLVGKGFIDLVGFKK